MTPAGEALLRALVDAARASATREGAMLGALALRVLEVEGLDAGESTPAPAVTARRSWPDVRRLVINRDGGRCRICGLGIRPGRETIDHIRPRSMGGGDELENLRAVHPFCNNSRGPHEGRNRPTVLHSDEHVRARHFLRIELRQTHVLDDLADEELGRIL